jgi:hypothetical protein
MGPREGLFLPLTEYDAGPRESHAVVHHVKGWANASQLYKCYMHAVGPCGSLVR